MRDTKRAISSKLTSQNGIEAVGKNTNMHEHTLGAHVMNDHVESHFGKLDFLARTFRYATTENLSGMTQQSYNHDFELIRNVASDRRKSKAGAGDAAAAAPATAGFFHSGLTDRLRESLVLMTRLELKSAQADGRATLQARSFATACDFHYHHITFPA